MDPIEGVCFDNEAKCLAQLGNFSTLPTEIRLMIWEFLFIQIPTNACNPPQPTGKVLSILRCSRFLYNEISYHLYHNLTHAIQIWPLHDERKWMSARVISKHFDTTWDLKDLAAVQRHIQNFPHSKTLHRVLHVEITRLSKSDLGQIIEIWQKANKLIEIVQGASPTPHVHISLAGKWRHRGRLIQSVAHPEGYRPDHDIAIIPFTRLNDLDYSLSKSIRTALSLESQRAHPSLLYRIRERDGAQMNQYHSIGRKQGIYEDLDVEQWLTETRIFLDSKLDDLPGETAERLRLERCLNWYEDGDKWTSAYETQFIADLATNPELVRKFDPDFLHVRERHKLTILLHHAIHEQLRYIGIGIKTAPQGAENQDPTEGVIDNMELHTRWNENILSTKMKGINLHGSWNSDNWSKVHTRIIFASLARLHHPGHDVTYALYTNEISSLGDFKSHFVFSSRVMRAV